ncbi:hypothetical protein L1987_74641 [Smallanthus sonchifolius]|uniref:Uncharacterized protein n=1 Tax=Smallanthus sonchifolius TaxID=185202 RepID=A0ACB9A351_9ASTR|nr:hypothetical protein L1987_74641 [Smallanthus sonchifolius]
MVGGRKDELTDADIEGIREEWSTFPPEAANATVYHAVARTLINSETVYGLALCRQYLSNSECLKCFDIAAKEVGVCGIVNGARAIFDDCELR